MKGKWVIAVAATVWALLGAAPRLRAQDASSITKTTTLWVDERTGQVFIRPGRGRIPMSIGPSVDAARIEQQVEDSTNAKVQAAVTQAQEQQRQKDEELAKKVDEMQPAWKSYLGNWQDKFRVGALFYGDYRFYSLTGFQPQELTQITNPGPGNNSYNSFDVTRTYLNFYFFPTKDWTLRLTPNMYKTIGSSNDAIGRTGQTTAAGNQPAPAQTGFGSNLDGDLGVRMKYAYIQYSNLWKNVPALKGGTVTLGQQANPLVAWEEDLYGYRFVNLTPWNYLSLSSTQVGISMQGPIKLRGGEKTYLDYDFGVYDNASFHAYEQSDTKQVMGRLTAYPFGADWRYQGLGLTGFYDYGWGNTTPDNNDIVTTLKAVNAHFDRIAALVHYSQPLWNIVGEFDYGQNAFSLGNLFSGSGPSDAFGTPSGPSLTSGNQQRLTGNPNCSSTKPCYDAWASWGPQTAVWQALLQNGQERNIGLDFFGHFNIPNTKLSLFGMFQWFMPNDHVDQPDPLDFQRWIVGVAYQYNEYLRFAVDSQNLSFYHNQGGMSVSKAAQFGYNPAQTFNGRLVPSNPNFIIPNLTPSDTHSVFANVEFSY